MNFVVIACYNEEKHIAEVINKVKKHTKNIVIVDDGSTDKTLEIIKKLEVTFISHIINLGKGSALKTGCDYAIKQGADTIIVLDADGQHDPADIPRFLENLHGNDIVFGYRPLSKNMPALHRLGNWFITEITKVLYGIKLKDTQSGYRAFTKSAYKKIRWKASDYSMESEMVTLTGKNKLKYEEIPIHTIYSDKYKGTTIFDGIKIVFNLLFWKITK